MWQALAHLDMQHLRDALTHPKYLRMRQRVSLLCDQTITLELPERLSLSPTMPAAPPPPIR
ncbi:MAG: hypothetical protein J2P36_29480 [Ktedonobacteraceae bacterium]|nr:hypothetical protein [Ktedonobacteraceae bacterium]